VYSFGSIVFVNVNKEQMHMEWISRLQDPQVGHTVHAERYEDDVTVVIDPALREWSKSGHNHFAVKVLDLNNSNVIAAILARSVALESYEVQVQTILEQFKNLNQTIRGMNHSWVTTASPVYKQTSRKMIPVIAQGNELKCDLLLNVRIFDRPPESWEYDQYDTVYETLSSEFEIDERYMQLEKKLDFVQENTQFFMELQQSKKTERQEWLIIILIFTEIMIAIAHHWEERQRRKE
jgi:uncharacterized Rmd1/YagE family protein